MGTRDRGSARPGRAVRAALGLELLILAAGCSARFQSTGIEWSALGGLGGPAFLAANTTTRGAWITGSRFGPP